MLLGKVTSDSDRTNSLSRLGLSYGIGMMLGPPLGRYLSASYRLPKFNVQYNASILNPAVFLKRRSYHLFCNIPVTCERLLRDGVRS